MNIPIAIGRKDNENGEKHSKLALHTDCKYDKTNDRRHIRCGLRVCGNNNSLVANKLAVYEYKYFFDCWINPSAFST